MAQAGKGMEQKINRTNYYGRGQRRWHNVSSKFARSSQIPAS